MKKADLVNMLINNAVGSILIDGEEGLREYKFDDLEIKEIMNDKLFLICKTRKRCCGDVDGTEKISNPNLDMGADIDWSDSKSWWMVCKDCKDLINAQKGLDIARIIGDEVYAKRLLDKIEEIAIRTKKPVFNGVISKNDVGDINFVGVEFTGEKK